MTGPTDGNNGRYIRHNSRNSGTSRRHNGSGNGFRAYRGMFARRFRRTLAFIRIKRLSIFFANVGAMEVSRQRRSGNTRRIRCRHDGSMFQFRRNRMYAGSKRQRNKRYHNDRNMRAVAKSFTRSVFVNGGIFELARGRKTSNIGKFRFTRAISFKRRRAGYTSGGQRRTGILRGASRYESGSS